jgi:hypothetical protein
LLVEADFYFSFSFWRLYTLSDDDEDEDALRSPILHLLKRNRFLRRDHLHPGVPHRINPLGGLRVKDIRTRLSDLALEIQPYCPPQDTITTKILPQRQLLPMSEIASHWRTRHMKEN